MPRTILGAWAAAGLRAGFLLGTGQVAATAIVGVAAGTIGSALAGTLGSAFRSAGTIAWVTIVALLVAGVFGPSSR